jgi:small subunit ribosomal protein SAe
MSQYPAALNPKEEDIQKMLACGVHLGTTNLDPLMARYVWKRRTDGVHLIDLQKTWEKLVMAARIIVAIDNPQDIVVISAREYGQRSVLKFSKYTGVQALAGRFTPGTFTNQSQPNFIEPRLIVLTDPRTDYQPLRESAYVNIPTIAFCNTDAPLPYVDVVIPCNNKGKHSIGLLWWLLCREVLLLKNTPNMIRGQPWDVMVDLFLYRAPEEQEKQEEATTGEDQPPFQADWSGQGATGEQWGDQTQQDWGGNYGAPTTTEGQASWDAPTTGGSWDAQQE